MASLINLIRTPATLPDGGSKVDYLVNDLSLNGQFHELDSFTNSVERSTAPGYNLFPVKVGPDLYFNGSQDGFIARINRSGMKLDYCGYIGGTGDDYAWGIATNKTFPNSDAYVVGRTNSTEVMGFPLKHGPDLMFHGNGPPLGQDTFVAKVSKP